MSRNTKELRDLAEFSPGKNIKKWKIISMLDEGGFGRVYKVEYRGSERACPPYAALKVESINMQGGSAIKLEVSALKNIRDAGKGNRTHVPRLFHYAKRMNCCYMIITLLGKNLDRIKKKYGMPLRTWSRIGIQCLYAVKTLHDSGYVHRDLKPGNFILGHPSDPLKARVVHVVDFGLSREYAYRDKETNKWIARRPRTKCEFRGTWYYSSASMHDSVEQGRKDDLWSLLYMLIELYCGLPWSKETEDATAKMKKEISDKDLLAKMPKGLELIPTHLRTLEQQAKPDYSIFYECLHAIQNKENVEVSDWYEWETDEEAERNKEAMEDPANKDVMGFVDPEMFFVLDPINVSPYVKRNGDETKANMSREAASLTTENSHSGRDDSGKGKATKYTGAQALNERLARGNKKHSTEGVKPRTKSSSSGQKPKPKTPQKAKTPDKNQSAYLA